MVGLRVINNRKYMSMNNKMESVEMRLGLVAKLLSVEHGKQITPGMVVKAYKLHVFSGLPYKQCVEAVWFFEMTKTSRK